MKRHEACHYLNKLAEDIKRSISYRQEDCDRPREGDTDEKVEQRKRYSAERIAEHEKELEALDIAGDALAPNR
jgi:hypothetical protein